MKQTQAIIILIVLAFIPGASRLCAQGTAFTYNGSLSDGAGPATGTYDFQFSVRDALTGGSAVGANPLSATLVVSNGLFTATLDPGAGVFAGADRWLEIAVRTNGAALFTTLAPRHKFTATPYAIAAGAVTGVVSAGQLTGTISSINIASGSITGEKLANGAVGTGQLAAGAVTTGTLADGAITAPKVAMVTKSSLVTTFANPTPATSDFFGWSVAAVGSDRVLIAAHWDDTSAPDAGAAYLFSANGMLLTTFTNPTPAAGANLGYSVAAVGSDHVLISPDIDNTGATAAGAAYLFSTNGTLVTTFTNPTPEDYDFFGKSVAAVGSDRVLIGAFADNTGATDAGAAYLFSTNGTLLTTFTNPTPADYDVFGVSVAAVGSDRVLIGAYWDDTGAPFTGAAYLFSTNGTLLTTFTNPTPANDDRFGASVAAVGNDRVLVGAYLDDTGATDSGAAYLFSTNGTLLTTFANPTPTAGDNFGISVAAVGSDRVLIAAYLDDTGASDAGAAYLFSTDGTLLTTFTNPTPANDDRFGVSVAAVGSNRVLIGGYYDDTGATDAGAAYLFSLDSYTPGLVAEGVRSGSITTSSLEDGAVTAAKIGGVLSASQIPDLDASKVTSGVLALTRLPAVVLTNGATNVNLAGTFNGNGAGLTNLTGLNASQLTFGTVPATALSNAWRVGGNSGMAPGTHFLGTTDNQPLEFKVNNARALRLEYATHPTLGFCPNIVGGYSANFVSIGARGATIGGGGASGFVNSVTAEFGTVAGGLQNTVSSGSGAVGGGWANVASGPYATVPGGYFSTASGPYSFAAGGANNNAAGTYSFAAGYHAKANHFSSFVWSDGSGGDFASTSDNQFLIRAAGGVGIGKNNPVSALDVNGVITATSLSATQLRSSNLTSRSPGEPLQINAPNGTGSGGPLTLAGGDAGTANGGGGGSVTVRAGSAVPQGGGGYANQGPAGAVAIHGGGGYNGVGGNVVLQSGVNSPWSLTPNGFSKISMQGGALNSGDGAIIDVEGGHNPLSDGSAVSSGGNVRVTAGNAAGAYSGGNIILTPGTGSPNGNVGIGTTTPAFTLEVNGSAGKPGGGSWSVASDARLKQHIRPLAGALDKLLALRGMNFEYIDPAKIHELSGERMGLIAQEVERVFPDWVETGPDGYKRMTVRGLEALVVEAVRELQQKQEAKLAEEMKRRDAENAELKQSVAELKELVGRLAKQQVGGAR